MTCVCQCVCVLASVFDCGKGLSVFYSLPLCSTFPFLTISPDDLSKMLSVEKQVYGCYVCRRETWCHFWRGDTAAESVSRAWRVDSPSTQSCMLYYRWSSWLFTAGQNDPQGHWETTRCSRWPVRHCQCLRSFAHLNLLFLLASLRYVFFFATLPRRPASQPLHCVLVFCLFNEPQTINEHSHMERSLRH